MIEELVNKIAELQTELVVQEDQADKVSAYIDGQIKDTEERLKSLREERTELRQPFTDWIEETKTTIDDLYQMIIDEWDGEKKTLKFDVGTLKFAQRGSLKIKDEVNLFLELHDHLAIENLVENYLKGFNLTVVKKYMSVHELPTDVAEIEYTTTVKLKED